MVHPHSVPQTQHVLPTMYDLPSESPEDPGLPDEFHEYQPQLLRETCQPTAIPADEIFIGTDLNLYYDSRHANWYKRPDWFLVLGVMPARHQQDLRWSYLIWQEAVAPYLVVELLSPGTEDEDLGQTLREVNQQPTKWQVYEQVLRIPYYAVYDRYQNQFRLFQLQGSRYQPVAITDSQFWFGELQLGLGVWSGSYERITGLWLRWYDASGCWILTNSEQVEQERILKEEAQSQLEQERIRVEKLKAKLRELGLDEDLF